jgi:hypothetical protein
MRRPVKPFAVEVRRAGRRVPQSFIPARELQDAPQPDYFTPLADLSAAETQRALEQAPTRRVLQDLSEATADPLAERLQELESRLARRGRPRGSKNKVQRTQATTDLSGFFDTPESAPTPVPLAAVPFKRRPREQRFGWVKKKLRRGERWKRRLPRILW